MRHRQLVGDDAVGLNVDQHPALVATLAPAAQDVAAADGGDVTRRAVMHGHAVQVAAILGGQLGDEGRLPDRREAVARRQRRQAGVLGVDEDDPPGPIHAQFVDVHVARGLDVARHVEAIEMLIGPLARRQRVFKAPNLKE
ncbi:hypothetical protein D3C87_1793000 [compost metagenome]